MHSANPWSSSSAHERVVIPKGRPGVSIGRWKANSVPFFVQLYLSRMPHCRLLYTQLLNDFTQEKSNHERKGQSALLKLFDGISLQKLVTVENLLAGTSKTSTRIAEQP